MRCLIIDDEPIARQIIEKYSAILPEIEIIRSCSNALEAKQIINSRPVDLIFLDINMPVLDGLAFIKTLTHPPQIIFTTAYKEYAHQAFDLAACDYLLKPFSLERFIVAVDKAREKLSTTKPKIAEQASETHTYLKSEGKIFKIDFSEICYAEADGNWVKIVTDGGLLRVVMTFSAIEEQLPQSNFIRLHRSFIINKSKISHIEGNRVFLGTIEIPIGANYRSFFLREIGLS